MAELKCKICGGSLAVEEGSTIATCEYCGTKQTLPKLSDERRMQMYDRANHFRRNSDYDKAMGLFEQILNEDTTDAEAYWSIVLCRYGIEYVEDPTTHQRKPTVNRTQFASIFADEDYKSAIEYADANQREIYEVDAKSIDNIQKGILEISQKEEPFDVFICYKETDNAGRRTPDSVLANELYHQLTQEGLKVFFSRITLEDKIGEAYEPYIFAALNSAKVMVVLGTRPEYFKAVWVRNEWSRFLSQIKAGAKKSLVPAYKDMDPYDLPDEFSNLQAQDMSKLGFMQDLIRGIKKLTETEYKPTQVVKETKIINTAGNSDSDKMVKRATFALEDADFVKADEFAEKALDLEPENANAYLIKLMIEFRIQKKDLLEYLLLPFDRSSNYKKVIRFGDEKLKNEMIELVENNRQYLIYKEGCSLISNTDIASNEEAIKKFKNIENYKDSKDKINHCSLTNKQINYDTACIYMDVNNIAPNEKAIKIFESIIDYKDSKEKISICNQNIKRIKENKEILQKEINDGIMNNMVDCPAGSFLMGSSNGFLGVLGGEIGRRLDEIQHTVIISKPFKIGKYPVTQKLYKIVMNNNPSKYKGENKPVVNVTWNNAKEFCNMLNRCIKNIPTGYKFDLPTEAQWEYACRAGTTTALNNGKNINSETGICSNLNEVGWYLRNSDSMIQNVGQKKPNDWGIYDMHGNVWEWCRDCYIKYPSSKTTDPICSAGSEYNLRGGSCNTLPNSCRSASRNYNSPNSSEYDYGFRIALVPIE